MYPMNWKEDYTNLFYLLKLPMVFATLSDLVLGTLYISSDFRLCITNQIMFILSL